MLEWLKKILGDGYTEDIDKQVSEEIGKNFVAKNDFNLKNEALKAAEKRFTETEQQLKALQESSGDAESLKRQIEGLQKSNAEAKKAHDKELSDLKFSYALDAALSGAKVRDTISVKAHLNTGDLKLNEDGTITGLDAQLEKLRTDADYLFENTKPAPHFADATPGVPTGKKPSEMTYSEMAAYLEAHPGAEI